MHRDIKPGNIFLTSELTSAGTPVLKIGDLGHSRTMSSRTLAAFSDVGSPFYMSPEAVTNSGHSFSSDVWSLGCLLYELSMLHSPFFDRNINLYALGLRIQECNYQPLPSRTFSQSLRELVGLILVSNPSQRPTASQVFEVAQLACTALDLGAIPDVPIEQLPMLINHTQMVRANAAHSHQSAARSQVPQSMPPPAQRIEFARPTAVTVSTRRTSPRTSPRLSPVASDSASMQEQPRRSPRTSPTRPAASSQATPNSARESTRTNSQRTPTPASSSSSSSSSARNGTSSMQSQIVRHAPR